MMRKVQGLFNAPILLGAIQAWRFYKKIKGSDIQNLEETE